MSFIVSARKYRPQRFSEVKGQQHVTQTLRNALKRGQVAQAFLFCGLKGSGKTTSARLLAKAINCDALTPEGEPCNNCSSCLQCQQQTSFNMHELDAASHNSAEDMRHIVEQMRYHAPNGKKTVIIIDEAHMLSNAALNVLLKPLEDTPPHIVFMLVTTEKHKILPTILSRCQVFDFRHIEDNEMMEQLQQICTQEGISYEEEALELIVRKAQGSLRDALSMFDLVVTFEGNKQVSYTNTLDHLHLLHEETYFKLSRSLYEGEIGEALLTYQQVARKGFDLYAFLIGFLEHFRNILVAKQVHTLALLQVNRNAQATYQEEAKKLPTSYLYAALDLLAEAQAGYKESLHQGLHIELALIRLGQLNQQGTIPSSPQKQKYPAKSFSSANPSLQTSAPISSPPLDKEQTVPPLISPSPSSPHIRKKRLLSTGKIPSTIEGLEVLSKHSNAQKDLPLTWERIKPHWDSFGQQYKREDHPHAGIFSFSFRFEANQIRLTLHDDQQVNFLVEIKERLLRYLSKKLGVPYERLALKIERSVQNPKEEIPYTNLQKWKYLKERYPIMQQLDQKLKLQFIHP